MVICKVSIIIIIILICRRFRSLELVKTSLNRLFLLAREFRGFIMRLWKRENLKHVAKNQCHRSHFSVKNWNSVFSCTSSNFLRYFLLLIKVRKIKVQMWSNICYWKIPKLIVLRLLDFVFIVGFDVEAPLDNVKLAILERVELHIFFSPSQPWLRQIRKFSSGKFSGILRKLKCPLRNIRKSAWEIFFSPGVHFAPR